MVDPVWNPEAHFTLHPQLEADTKALGMMPLCQVLLMDNMLFPWVILVPRIPGLKEITDLVPEKRTALMEEISLISSMMQLVYSPDKMNVAALGNMVPQLHIHIIARYKTDHAWPNPVWGNGNKPYTPHALQEVMDILQRDFAKISGFEKA